MKNPLTLLLIAVSLTAPLNLSAQETPAQSQTQNQNQSLSQAPNRVWTLEDCRTLAVQNNRDLDQARTRIEMAQYDKKIARANYFPKVSATGTYQYNGRDIALISDTQSASLLGAGDVLQSKVTGIYNSLYSTLGGVGQQVATDWAGIQTQLQTAIMSNPALAAEVAQSPMWQTLLRMMGQIDPTSIFANLPAGGAPDVATPLGAIAKEIDDALHPDLRNVFAGVVSVQQPVFVGGKIIYSNQMADLAEELSRSKYDMQYADLVSEVNQAYWQVVSVAAKRELAQAYVDLLEQLEKDVTASVAAGVMTRSDELQIQVKANEARMLLTKARNGESLSRMLLCQRMGLPLETEITLSDEGTDVVPMPVLNRDEKEMEAIYADRPETRSLDLAGRIYDRKAKVVRADMLPQIALTANYIVSNPNLYNGFQKNFGGMFNAGVMMSVPLFHGCESLNKYKKAQAEARLYQSQLADAREKIGLQVARERKLLGEALQHLEMSESNLSQAEENLRSATVGFEAGVIPANTVLAAQTAWLQAHSEYIDAGVGLQMAASDLDKAEGNYTDNK